MRRALILITAVIMIAWPATAASAARPAPPVAVFRIDPASTTLPAAQVAADWSKGTNILVQVGPCSGPGCVRLSEPSVPTHCATFPGTILGCGGFTLDDGSCGVEVSSLLRDYPDARQRATAHEFGHCAGLAHSTDQRAVMYPTSSLHPKVISPTRPDKAAINARYPRT